MVSSCDIIRTIPGQPQDKAILKRENALHRPSGRVGHRAKATLGGVAARWGGLGGSPPAMPAGARPYTEQLRTVAGEEWASRAGEGGHDRERKQAARDEAVARRTGPLWVFVHLMISYKNNRFIFTHLLDKRHLSVVYYN